MVRKAISLIFLLSCISVLYAVEATEQSEAEELEYQAMVDSIEGSFDYQIGTIDLDNGLATLVVPDGYRFLGSEQSAYVLSSLWGNPPSSVMGLLFPKGVTPLGDNFTYVVSISYSEEGYIDDEDAEDLDYDEILETMQEDVEAANDQRIAMGYGSAKLIGWASPPFYDKVNKKLHWAKELEFDGSKEHTLNYNIRILGRRGYVELNVIGSLDVLPLVKQNVDQILASVEFEEGHTYADFDPEIDEIAAYGIGGLIAGKVLLKLGLLAGFLKFFKVIGLAILKFWKPITIAVVALGAGIKKYFYTTKANENPEAKKDNQVTEHLPDKAESEEDGEVTDGDFEDNAK